MVDDRAGAFESKYPVGGAVEVYVDSNNPPTAKVFRGKIEYWPKSALGLTKILKIHATDYFYERILNVTAAETYTNIKVGAIFKDLVQKYLPSGFSSDLTGIQDSDVAVESITFRDEKLKSIFDRLAKLAGNWEYYCNPLLKVFFYPKNGRSTGLTVTDADIDPVPSQVKELYSMRTDVIVRGGYDLKTDQSQETTTGNATSHSKHFAQKFTPTQIDMRQVSLNIEKVGSPDDLTGKIVQDNSNAPTGPQIVTFRISKDVVSGTNTWYPARAIGKLDTAKSYWVVIDKIGDASSHYKIYHDSSSTGSHAESDDGTSWTIVNSSYRIAFKEQYGHPVLARATNTKLEKDYERRTIPINDTTIIDKIMAKRIALGVLDKLKNVQENIEDLKHRSLTSIPQVGETVNLNLSDLGISNVSYRLDSLTLELKRGHETIDGPVVMNVGDFNLEDEIAKIVQELKGLAIKDTEEVPPRISALNEDLLLSDGLEARSSAGDFQESVPCSDSLTKTTCTAYQIETDSPPNCAFTIGKSEIGLGA